MTLALFVQRIKKEEYIRQCKPSTVILHCAWKLIMSSTDILATAAMRFIVVPEDQQQEYSTVFDNLWRFVIEVDLKMTMYVVLLPEDLIRRLIAMVRSPNLLQPCLFLT